MKSAIKSAIKPVLLLLSLPWLLACPGPIGDPVGPIQSAPPVRSMGIHGDVVAGGYGVTWDVETATPSAALRWHLEGGGVLLTADRKTVGYSDPDLPHFGCYVPPATAPLGGTVQIWFEVFNASTQRWESSFKYPFTVRTQTAPMGYFVPSDYPTSASILAGGKATFTILVNPRPLDFQQRTALVSSGSGIPELGTATLVPVHETGWSLEYQAPAVVPSAFNVTVQAIAHDPWADVDRMLEFRVHVEP